MLAQVNWQTMNGPRSTAPLKARPRFSRQMETTAVQQSHHRLSQDSLRMSEAFQQHSMSVGLLHGPDVGFARHFEAILSSEMFGFFPQNTSGILR